MGTHPLGAGGDCKAGLTRLRFFQLISGLVFAAGAAVGLPAGKGVKCSLERLAREGEQTRGGPRRAGCTFPAEVLEQAR